MVKWVTLVYFKAEPWFARMGDLLFPGEPGACAGFWTTVPKGAKVVGVRGVGVIFKLWEGFEGGIFVLRCLEKERWK